MSALDRERQKELGSVQAQQVGVNSKNKSGYFLDLFVLKRARKSLGVTPSKEFSLLKLFLERG